MNRDLTAIVAVDAHWAIGRQGDLLFSLPTDMKRFRALTLGHSVLMGRKTLDSFPGGRPLPKRRNIVLTTQDALSQSVEVVHTVDQMLSAVGAEAAFVIGGGAVYQALLPYCARALVTHVQAQAPEADTFFPNLQALEGWQVVDTSQPVTENGYTYTFVEYRNVNIDVPVVDICRGGHTGPPLR